MEPADEVLRIRDVCARLGLSRHTVEREIAAGRLKAKRFGSRGGWRIRRVDYDAWLATPTPPKEKQP